MSKSLWFPRFNSSFPMNIIRLLFFYPYFECLYHRSVKCDQQLCWHWRTKHIHCITYCLAGHAVTPPIPNRGSCSCCPEAQDWATGRERSNLWATFAAVLPHILPTSHQFLSFMSPKILSFLVLNKLCSQVYSSFSYSFNLIRWNT